MGRVLMTDDVSIGRTPNDVKVLAVLTAAGRPLTAYQIIEAMLANRPRISPPTVYRALARLTRLGEVCRVETMNAWAAVVAQEGLLAICDECGSVRAVSAPDILAEIERELAAEGFHGTKPTLEIHGRCGSCEGARGE